MASVGRWLTLERGDLPSFRRFVGVLMLFITPVVFSWSHGGPGPYRVPAWWLGATPIALPAPSATVDVLAWSAYAAAALALILGGQGRGGPAVGAAVLAYYGSCDLMACNASYVVMVFGYLVALLFDRDGPSCARRLVQIGVSACYGYSALHKAIHPDWAFGHTLADLFTHEANLRPFWAPLARALPRGDDVYWAPAIGVIAVEAFIAAGLWAERTRRAAVLCGFLLHASFLIVLPGVDVFAPTMMAGLLTFLALTPRAVTEAGAPPRREVALAGVVALVLLAMPARLYLLPGPPSRSLTFYDRSPWSFSMFLFLQEVESVSAEAIGPDGRRDPLPLVGRMPLAGSQKELRAMAAYLLRTHPEAAAIEVRSRLCINHRRHHWEVAEARRRHPLPTSLAARGGR
jgi:hypothetical protein